MPTRAFVPAPLSQAEPRVYRSFRGRQIKGLFLAAAGGALGLLIFGARNAAGFGATFLMALPGFAFGYYQPDGKPLEYWLQVQWRYASRPKGWKSFRPLRRRSRRAVSRWMRVVFRSRRLSRVSQMREGA